MFRLTLRKKRLLFAIAIVPLLVAGRAMIRITEEGEMLLRSAHSRT